MAAALEGALPLGGPGEREVEVVDPRAEVHPLVAHRLQLQRVVELAPLLSDDQRLVLACQVALGMSRAEFCERFGWSFERYRKVAQRARAAAAPAGRGPSARRAGSVPPSEPGPCPTLRAGSD